MAENKTALVKRYRKLVEDVKMSSVVDLFETRETQDNRKKHLLSHYAAFAEYYFPLYTSAKTAAFQVKAANDVYNMPNLVHLWQWSREFAKSVHASLILPLYLYFSGELTGMITGCANEDDAILKLQDIQVAFENNERIKHDFGELKMVGNWEDGDFALRDGVFFRGFGRKQSPRGVRFLNNRPNYGLLDDIDTKELVKNMTLSKDNYDWCKEDFMGALSIRKWRVVVAENKFHKNTVTAQFENDKEVKVRLSRVNMLNDKGESNWPEHFTTDQCNAKISAVGYMSAQREYFNNPIEEGTIFKADWFHYIKPLKLSEYDELISYTDPSYKNTEKSDYKCTVLIGKKGIEYHVLKVFIGKTSVRSMFEWLYAIHDYVGGVRPVTHYMEANFLQDLLWGELNLLAKDKGYMIPVSGDKRSKPDKYQRIEGLQPLFERGVIKFSIIEKDSPGMLLLVSQFLAFEKGSRVNDDGPDAVEGAIHILNQKTLTSEPVAYVRRPANKKRF